MTGARSGSNFVCAAGMISASAVQKIEACCNYFEKGSVMTERCFPEGEGWWSGECRDISDIAPDWMRSCPESKYRTLHQLFFQYPKNLGYVSYWKRPLHDVRRRRTGVGLRNAVLSYAIFLEDWTGRSYCLKNEGRFYWSKTT